MYFTRKVGSPSSLPDSGRVVEKTSSGECRFASPPFPLSPRLAHCASPLAALHAFRSVRCTLSFSRCIAPVLSWCIAPVLFRCFAPRFVRCTAPPSLSRLVHCTTLCPVHCTTFSARCLAPPFVVGCIAPPAVRDALRRLLCLLLGISSNGCPLLVVFLPPSALY